MVIFFLYLIEKGVIFLYLQICRMDLEVNR